MDPISAVLALDKVREAVGRREGIWEAEAVAERGEAEGEVAGGGGGEGGMCNVGEIDWHERCGDERRDRPCLAGASTISRSKGRLGKAIPLPPLPCKSSADCHGGRARVRQKTAAKMQTGNSALPANERAPEATLWGTVSHRVPFWIENKKRKSIREATKNLPHFVTAWIHSYSFTSFLSPPVISLKWCLTSLLV